MTHKSDLKAIIRARMLKTGERYAAARWATVTASGQRRCECEDECLSDRDRRCQECGDRYCQVPDVAAEYFYYPTDYSRGSERYCLACWLGVGPKDVDPGGVELPRAGENTSEAPS